MSRRPKRSRAEQRTPTVIQADPPALPVPVGGRIVELGAPFDEELPALSAEVLAAAGLIAHVDFPQGGLKAGDTVAVSIVPLPAWWPEDADQQSALVAACDAFDLGYNEINGARFDGSTLILVTIGGTKIRWPEDVGKVMLTDMQRGRLHEHTGPGRQFPNGYLRRDPRRDPKE